MSPADLRNGTGATLEADVMRFMAIIAFCLMAILALVRSVEPPQTHAVAPAAREEVPPTAGPATEPTTPATPSVRPLLPAPAVPRPVAEPAGSRPAATETATERESARSRAGPEPAPAAPADPVPSAERGLNLRFASQQDFLRLVNRGDLRLFAFREDEVLAVSADFRFQPADAPGALHELLPETIPPLMARALYDRAAGSTGETYRWGIVMPDRMARQIRRYVERGVSGDLVIDRFGEVHHEA